MRPSMRIALTLETPTGQERSHRGAHHRSVGFVAIAGAVVLWFYEGGSSSSSAPPAVSAKTSLKASLVPSLSPNHAGASFGLTF